MSTATFLIRTLVKPSADFIPDTKTNRNEIPQCVVTAALTIELCAEATDGLNDPFLQQLAKEERERVTNDKGVPEEFLFSLIDELPS